MVPTCGLHQGGGREEAADSLQAEAALVEAGLPGGAGQEEGAVTEQPPGPGAAHLQRDPVLHPGHLGRLRGGRGAVQAGGLPGLEDAPYWPRHDLEVGKVPLTWN